MIGWIANIIGSGVIGQIGKELNRAYQAKLDAKNQTERIDADKEIASLEVRKAVLVAEARTSWNIIFRGFLALPFALFVWKVIVWDKLLKLGVTDPLDDNMWKLLGIVYGFYFVYETAALFKRG